jgi:hypothetical protein
MAKSNVTLWGRVRPQTKARHAPSVKALVGIAEPLLALVRKKSWRKGRTPFLAETARRTVPRSVGRQQNLATGTPANVCTQSSKEAIVPLFSRARVLFVVARRLSCATTQMNEAQLERAAPLASVFFDAAAGLTLPASAKVLDSLGLTKHSVFCHVNCCSGTLVHLVALRFGCTVIGVDSRKQRCKTAQSSAAALGLDARRCTFYNKGIINITPRWLHDQHVTHLWCYDHLLDRLLWPRYKNMVCRFAQMPSPVNSRHPSLKKLQKPVPKPPKPPPSQVRIVEELRGSKAAYLPPSDQAAVTKGQGSSASANSTTNANASATPLLYPLHAVVSCLDERYWHARPRANCLHLRGRHVGPYDNGTGHVLVLCVWVPSRRLR